MTFKSKHLSRKMFIGENVLSGIMVLNVILALVALFRDISLAYVLGTSAKSDALLLAFSIPDFLGNNLVAMAIGVTCVPVLAEIYTKEGKKQFEGATKSILFIVSSFSVFILLIGYIFGEDIISALGRGMAFETLQITKNSFYILLPTVLLFSIFTIGTAISNLHDSFYIPASGPIVFNLIFIAGTIFGAMFFPKDNAIIYIISISISIGVLAMTLLVWIHIRKRGWMFFFPIESLRLHKENIKIFLRILTPYFLVLIAFQSVLYFERYLASFLEVGTISGLNYAYRISQLPIWVFVAAVGTFSLPKLSRLNGSGKYREFDDGIIEYLKLTFLILLPFVGIFSILNRPLVQMLFQWGAFDEVSIDITSGILGGYSFAILGQGVFYITIRFFLAMKYVKYPALIVFISSSIHIASAFYLVNHMGHFGIGYAAAIGGVLNAVLLVWLLNRRLKGLLRRHIVEFIKIALCNFPLFFTLGMVKIIWDVFLFSKSYPVKFVFGGIAFILCVVIYLFMIRILNIFRKLPSKLESGANNVL